MTTSTTHPARKVVCIEDEPAMIDLVKLILSKRGFDVRGALGGHAAIATVREVEPDLILLDLMMPDVDGWDIYQQIKADDELSHIPVIVVTARAASIDRTLGLHVAKVQGYITKPFTPDELVALINQVLGIEGEGVDKAGAASPTV